jgi:hypothetical protein
MAMSKLAVRDGVEHIARVALADDHLALGDRPRSAARATISNVAAGSGANIGRLDNSAISTTGTSACESASRSARMVANATTTSTTPIPMSAPSAPTPARKAWAAPTPATWDTPPTRPRQAKSGPRLRGSVDRWRSMRLRFSIDDRHTPRIGSTTNATGTLVNEPKATSSVAVDRSPPMSARRSVARRTTKRDEQHADDGSAAPTSADSRPGPVADVECLAGRRRPASTSNAPITRLRAADTLEDADGPLALAQLGHRRPHDALRAASLPCVGWASASGEGRHAVVAGTAMALPAGAGDEHGGRPPEAAERGSHQRPDEPADAVAVRDAQVAADELLGGAGDGWAAALRRSVAVC